MSGSYGSYVDNGSFTNSSYQPGSLTNTGTNSSSNLINGLAKVGGAGISIAGNLIGANQANQALNQAGQTITKYANQGIGAIQNYGSLAQGSITNAGSLAKSDLTSNATSGLGAIQAGSQAYADTINPLLTPKPIMIPTYRDQTQQQQIGEQDLIRNGQAALAADGLRGAGRAGVGAVLDEDQRYQAANRTANDAANRQALQTAQTTANTATQNLANEQAQAGGAQANVYNSLGSQLASTDTGIGSGLAGIQSGEGSNIAATDTGVGTNLAKLYTQQGTNSGNATTSSANTAAQTAGGIGGLLGGIAGIASIFA